jgi:phosphosulfolactate synthase
VPQLSGRLVDGVIGATREGKPRENGVTIASDYLGPVDASLLGQIAEYVDVVKFGLSVPLLAERSRLAERIRRYHDLGIKVMSGGTAVEVAVEKGALSSVLEGLRSLEFDIVEVSEFARELPMEAKINLVKEISGLSMEYVFEVGSRERSASSTSLVISKIREALELKSRRVTAEVPRDAKGDIAWDVLNEIAGNFGPPSLIFEVRRMSEATSLILEFGPTVNLAGASLDEVLILEMQRLGLTVETLGLSRSPQGFDGSPAAKFIYHLIRTDHPVDQTTLVLRSGLPRRTVQAALSSLVEGGLVREISDVSDLRRRKYTIR